MRLLVCGQFADTGFGTVTKELATRFVEAGLDVRVLADDYRGNPIDGPLEGRVWPSEFVKSPFGDGIVTAAIIGSLWTHFNPKDRWRPEAVLLVADVSGLMARLGDATPEIVQVWMSIPVYHYCPIEGDNFPWNWHEIWEMVRPVAMSDYGQRLISDTVGYEVPRIYHGVNTDVFRPVTPFDPGVFTHPGTGEVQTFATREACKAAWNLDGKKVVVRADRNVTRKFYDKAIAAFASIAAAEPDAVFLMHCQSWEREGISIVREIQSVPEHLRLGRYWLTGMHDTFRGLDNDSLRCLYNAGDVYLSTTGGEGFGLCLAEALACETPVVSTGWAAEKEVVGPGGITVPPLIDEYGNPVRYHSGYGMDWAVPDPRKFVEPTLRLLRKPSERRGLGKAGRAHVVRSFNWDTAAVEFLTLFEEAHAVAA